MKKLIFAILLIINTYGVAADSSFGPGEDPRIFYKPFDVENIPLSEMQSWPYYKYVSMHMAEFVAFGVADIEAAKEPAKLSPAGQPFDLNQEFKDGQSYLENLLATQTKGFVVIKDNEIYAEFYDNGYNRGMTNNLQSAAKTFAGVIIGKLVDAGEIELDEKVEHYLPELKGSVIGGATIRETGNMASGIEALGDYHTPGSNGYIWELEIGLQKKGTPIGHLKAIKNAKASGTKRGTKWEYTDQNTDTLGLIAEKVTGKTVPQLLQEIAEEAGYQYPSSIAKTSDGTTSPSFGINLSALDYALFHQYIAQGKAGKAFYSTAKDVERDVLAKGPTGEFMAQGAGKVTYGMQTYYLPDSNILMSMGSFGQLGFSDLESGISVINQQDWSINIDTEKTPDAIARSVAIIKALRATK